MLSTDEERPPLPPPAAAEAEDEEVGEDEEPAGEDAEEESDHVDDTTLVLGEGSDVARETDLESEPAENPASGSDGFVGGEMVPPLDEELETPPSKRPRIDDPASTKKESMSVTWNHCTVVGQIFG